MTWKSLHFFMIGATLRKFQRSRSFPQVSSLQLFPSLKFPPIVRVLLTWFFFFSSSKAHRLFLSFISSYSIFICHASFIYSSCLLFLLLLKCSILSCIRNKARLVA